MYWRNALNSACAVAPKRPQRLAHVQDDRIWTTAGATELDLAVAPKADQERPHPAPSHIPVAVDIQPCLMGHQRQILKTPTRRENCLAARSAELTGAEHDQGPR
jgi:hypothetical protein